MQQESRGLDLAGVVTLVMGLVFTAVGAEGLGMFDACITDPACLPGAGALHVDAFFAMLAAGIVLAVAGAWIILTGRVVTAPRVKKERDRVGG